MIKHSNLCGDEGTMTGAGFSSSVMPGIDLGFYTRDRVYMESEITNNIV